MIAFFDRISAIDRVGQQVSLPRLQRSGRFQIADEFRGRHVVARQSGVQNGLLRVTEIQSCIGRNKAPAQQRAERKPDSKRSSNGRHAFRAVFGAGDVGDVSLSGGDGRAGNARADSRDEQPSESGQAQQRARPAQRRGHAEHCVRRG